MYTLLFCLFAITGTTKLHAQGTYIPNAGSPKIALNGDVYCITQSQAAPYYWNINKLNAYTDAVAQISSNNIGSGNLTPDNFIILNGDIYFTCQLGLARIYTGSNYVAIVSPFTNSGYAHCYKAVNKIFFTNYAAGKSYVYDPSLETTSILKYNGIDVDPGKKPIAIDYNNNFYFLGRQGTSINAYLYQYNGNSTALSFFSNMNGFSYFSLVNAEVFVPVVINSKLILLDRVNSLLYSVDASNSNAVNINPQILSNSETNLTVFNNNIVFNANSGFYTSDGTNAGTVLSSTNYIGGFQNQPNSAFLVLNSKLIGVNNDAATGTELWQSDGTTNGTAMVSDIYAGASSSSPNNGYLNAVYGNVYFTANDGLAGNTSGVLYQSDGTQGGTIRIPGVPLAFNPYGISNTFNPEGNIPQFLYSYGNDGTHTGLFKFYLIPSPPSITSFAPTTAAAGTTVTINGTHFTGASNVSFGGVPAASFNIVSETAISAVVGSGASGGISITTSAGTGSKSGFSFCTVISPSLSISASTSTPCFNTKVIFTANPTNGGANPSFQWKKNGNDIATNSATYKDSTLVFGDVISCVMTSNAGCATSITNSTNSITITVRPLPIISFTTLAPIYNIAASGVTLTGSPIGGTFSGQGISGNVFTPSVAGVGGPYAIKYIYTDTYGCTNTDTQQTTVADCAVTATPGAISTAGGVATICPGDTKTYSIVAVAGATSYTWTPPTGGNITTGQGTTQVTISYTAAFTASGTLRVVANNACGFSAAKSLTIKRNTPATPSIITGLAYGVCNTSGVAYSVTNVAGRTFNWTFNTANASVASGQGTNAITANFLTGYTSGILSVTASNACGTSAARSITIKATTAAPNSITGTNTVCANQSDVPYSIAVLPGAVSYYWVAPAGAHVSDGVTTSTSTALTTTATAVTVNFGTTAGNVTVRGKNACGLGAYNSLPISITCFAKGEEVSKKRDAATEVKANELKAKLSPNPTSTAFVLQVQSINKDAVKVTVYNSEGKRIRQLKTTNLNNIILGEKYTSGSYLFEVRQGEKRTTVIGVKQ